MHIQPVWNQEGFKIISFTKITHHCISVYDTLLVLGGICSFFGDTIVSFFAITVHPPVVRQMDAFILKMTGGEAQFITVVVT